MQQTFGILGKFMQEKNNYLREAKQEKNWQESSLNIKAKHITTNIWNIGQIYTGKGYSKLY